MLKLTFSRYAFPPLLHDVIMKDMNLTAIQVANSNIVSLCATLVVRLIAGPSCDRFGPRKTFAGLLLIGAIPTFLAGAAFTVNQLYAVRFFIGILGGSFVPCQVWTTGFYDKNVVGTANSITAGLGNAGGGITYFLMPAIYNSFMHDGLSSHVAWRVTFVVPGIVIVTVALALLFLCPDTPTGKWADRLQAAENNLRQHGVTAAVVVDIPGSIDGKRVDSSSHSGHSTPPNETTNEEKKLDETRGTFADNEAQIGEQQMLDTARGEVIQKPSLTEIAKVMFSPQTLVLGAAYFCTFGAELSVNSVLGTYYGNQLKGQGLSLQTTSNYAAMFGLMNVVFRPLGGVVSDFVYSKTKNVWSKKVLIHSYAIITGAFLIAIGQTAPKHLGMLIGLIAIGMAFFLEGANGLVFSLVPHVHPYANGVVSGFTGACGNLGGIVFAIIFRYNPTNANRAMWIIGVVIMALTVVTCWVKPIPRGQIGGR